MTIVKAYPLILLAIGIVMSLSISGVDPSAIGLCPLLVADSASRRKQADTWLEDWLDSSLSGKV